MADFFNVRDSPFRNSIVVVRVLRVLRNNDDYRILLKLYVLARLGE